MSTAEPSAEAVPVFPRRGRRWRRLLKFVAGLAVVVVLGVGVLRVASLWGIPDAPEPFDVAAFLSTTIPADRNAAVLFARAFAMLDPGADPVRLPFPPLGTKGKEYGDTSPVTLAWIEAHRPALETWRRGTERPDALSTDRRVPLWGGVLSDQYFSQWDRLALIEAGRLEHEGDLEGAWAWHRARLRTPLLMARRRGHFIRAHLSHTFREAVTRAGDWARLPGMTVPLLRRAIGDVEAMAPLHGSEADSLKADYLAMMAEFDGYTADPASLASHVATLPGAPMLSPAAGLASRVVPPDWLRPAYVRAASFVEAEPERSRRIARMAFANWLSQADKRPADRPRTASTYPLVFDEDAGPTPSLSPRDLARRAGTAPYFAIARGGFAPPPAWWPSLDQWPGAYTADRQARADLILSLADRIFEIETGKPPATVEALIGTVLPKLPDDYNLSPGP